MAEVEDFLGSFAMLPLSISTAEHYAVLRTLLTAKGITLPDPDCWIAAHALESNLTLITTDRDFRHMPELRVHFVLPASD